MNERAIRKLRIKFIISATFAYMTAMMVMGAILYGTNVIVTNRQISSLLDYIVSHEGELPSPTDPPLTPTAGPVAEAAGEEDSPVPGEFAQNVISVNDLFVPNQEAYEAPDFLYSTRYFSVIFGPDQEVVDVQISHIAAVDEEAAVSLARSVLGKRPRFGNRGLYFYKRASLKKDRTIVVFLDSRSQVATNTRLLYTSLIVLGLGLIVVLSVVRTLSYHSIQPEIENARLQEQFLTNASHELKTPLAVIRANTEVEQMLHGENEWNTSTLHQIDRMTSLIQNLVLISRAQEKQDSSRAITVDASRAVSETVETFAPVASQEEKKLEKSIPEGLTLLGEEGDLRQLASLLIDNAIKYCDEKGTIRVTLAGRNRGPLRLTVSNDYLPGAQVDYERFFDRFYREDESHNIEKGGFGIGLSIAESLVKKYRGTIKASWRDGVISFTCVLKG